MNVARQPSHRDLRNEIILVGEVAHRPHEAARDGLGASFGAELDFPFHSRLIAHVKLRLRAVEILLDERERSMGQMLHPSGPVREVTVTNGRRFPPQKWLPGLTGLRPWLDWV